MMNRNREAVDEDRNISSRIRNLEFTAVRVYKSSELKPVGSKDSNAVFVMNKYIQAIESAIANISQDLDSELAPTVSKMVASSSNTALNPLSLKTIAQISRIKPLKGIEATVVGNGLSGGAGYNQSDANGTRLVNEWNSFINYIQSFRKLSGISQTDLNELYDRLDELIDPIETCINNILIIESQDKTKYHDYEKNILEILDDKILSKNLSKITLADIDMSKFLQKDITDLNLLAIEVDKDKNDPIKSGNISFLKNEEGQKLKDLSKLYTARKTWKTKNPTTDISLYTKNSDIEILEQEITDVQDELKNLKANATQYADIVGRLGRTRGRGRKETPIDSAIHFDDELNDLTKFYS